MWLGHNVGGVFDELPREPLPGPGVSLRTVPDIATGCRNGV